ARPQHLGCCHLRRERSCADKRIQVLLVLGRARRYASWIGGAHRFVRFLRILALRLVCARLDVLLPELSFDGLCYHGDRVLRKVYGVGAHVGNMAGLVQLLRGAHRARWREAQARRACLLERRGGEGRLGLALGRLFFHFSDDPRRCLSYRDDARGFLRIRWFFDAGSRELAAPLRREERIERVVRLWNKCLDFTLALSEDAECRRLHAPRGEPVPHLFPDKAREVVADEPVEHAACLLGAAQLFVYLARVGNRLLDRSLGYLVDDAALRLFQSHRFLHVPGDSLALAVGVRREKYLVRLFGCLLYLLDDVALIRRNDVSRHEA